MNALSTVSTAELQAELSRREGVKVLGLNYGDYAEVTFKGVALFGFDAPVERVTITGPALLTVNVD